MGNCAAGENAPADRFCSGRHRLASCGMSPIKQSLVSHTTPPSIALSIKRGQFVEIELTPNEA
jgi:hypothetical protein